MNPFKAIRKFLIFVYNDLKTDIEFIRDVSNGKKKFKLPDGVTFNDIFDKQFFYNLWLFLLILFAVFLSGWGLSAQHSENLCNKFIIETYHPELQIYGDFIIPVNESQLNILSTEKPIQINGS